MYLPYWFLKMTIRISHSHFVHAAFMSSLVCQTFDQMMYCIWKNEFSWNKVVRGDSTGPTNGTRSQKFGNGYQPRWFGNVSRMPQGRLTRRVLLLPTRRRSRSQPRTRLYNYIYDLAWSHQATTPAIPPERKSG